MGCKLAIGLLILLVLTGCGKRRPQSEYSEEESAEQPTIRSPVLPDSAFDVEWGKVELPASVPPNSPIRVSLRVTNHGNVVWPNIGPQATNSGAYAVRVSYRWCGVCGPSVEDYKERFDLPKPLAPGESAEIIVPVLTPETPGRYGLQFDLVQELVTWFQSKGAQTLIVPVTVQ
jgi:hypothetical protein